MINILNNKLFVIFLAPFFLGALTILSFAPYNITFINFFTFSVLLFLISEVRKRTKSKYRKKISNRYFFYTGFCFGFGFFLFGNYWISISLTHDESFKGLIPFAVILVPLFLAIVEGYRIRKSSWINVFFLSQGILLFVGFSNLVLGSNYMYLVQKPLVNNPMIIGEWPWYILGFEIMGLIHILIFYIGYRKMKPLPY